MTEYTEITAAFLIVICFGFTIGFGQELAKDLRQFRRRYRSRRSDRRLDRKTRNHLPFRFNYENTNPPSGPPPLKLRSKDPELIKDFSVSFLHYLQWKNQQMESAIRDSIRLDEGRVQRGNGKGGPTTPKPDITPKPQRPSPPDHPK